MNSYTYACIHNGRHSFAKTDDTWTSTTVARIMRGCDSGTGISVQYYFGKIASGHPCSMQAFNSIFVK